MLNRIANCKNQYQGKEKRVLCVCSAGLLRSPTAAFVIASEFGHNTRAVGVEAEYALMPLEVVHLHWADEVVVMEDWHRDRVQQMMKDNEVHKPVVVLGIKDNFPRMHPDLVAKVKKAYQDVEVMKMAHSGDAETVLLDSQGLPR